MDWYIVLLRLVHITAAASWVGASLTFALFVEPTARDLGPAGGAFMGHLANERKLPIVIAITSVVAIAAGALLYWRDSSGLELEWIRTRPGIGFTTGAVAAIVSWLIGFFVVRPGIDRSNGLRGSAATDPAAASQLVRLQQRLARASTVNALLLVLAVGAMSVARYL